MAQITGILREDICTFVKISRSFHLIVRDISFPLCSRT